MRYWMLMISALPLLACTGTEVRDVLGVNRAAPDEFKVVARPPLSVPPEFYLRPPQPGAPDLATESTETAAESLIIRGDKKPDPFLGGVAPSEKVDTAVDPTVVSDLEEITPQSKAAEEAFLSNFGVGDAKDNIRELIYEDNKENSETAETEYPLQEWLGLDADEDVVDPKAEAARIRKNKDEGKPINEGEVPTEAGDGPVNILDSIF